MTRLEIIEQINKLPYVDLMQIKEALDTRLDMLDAEPLNDIDEEELWKRHKPLVEKGIKSLREGRGIEITPREIAERVFKRNGY